MLIHPLYGPRIRLRALCLNAKIPATGIIDFDPCADCNVDCRKVCPENAMEQKMPIFNSGFSENLPARDGYYSREFCNQKMEKDASKNSMNNGQSVIKYCRKCEFACPVGKKAFNVERD